MRGGERPQVVPLNLVSAGAQLAVLVPGARNACREQNTHRRSIPPRSLSTQGHLIGSGVEYEVFSGFAGPSL